MALGAPRRHDCIKAGLDDDGIYGMSWRVVTRYLGGRPLRHRSFHRIEVRGVAELRQDLLPVWCRRPTSKYLTLAQGRGIASDRVTG